VLVGGQENAEKNQEILFSNIVKDYIKEFNQLMEFYSLLDADDDELGNITLKLPTLQKVLPEFSKFLPTKGNITQRARRLARASTNNGPSQQELAVAQVICQQQGVSTVPGPLTETALKPPTGPPISNANAPPRRVPNAYTRYRGKRGGRRRPRPTQSAYNPYNPYGFGGMTGIMPMLLLSTMNRNPTAARPTSEPQNGAMVGGANQGAVGPGDPTAYPPTTTPPPFDIRDFLLQQWCYSMAGQANTVPGLPGASSTAHPPHTTTGAFAMGGIFPILAGMNPGLGIPANGVNGLPAMMPGMIPGLPGMPGPMPGMPTFPSMGFPAFPGAMPAPMPGMQPGGVQPGYAAPVYNLPPGK